MANSHGTAKDLADGRWAEEKRDMQRRRTDSEFYDRLLQRLHFWRAT